jgi:23S rRNA pseudouridine2605 synthase
MRDRPATRTVGRTAASRTDPVTLARALSKLGYASRSRARSLITSGRVSVDGRVVRDPDRWIDLRSAKLGLDGATIRKKRHVYLAMHKPAGYVTTRSDERLRASVYDLLGEMRDWIFPVGRLDRDTSGLLLFTNDTVFGEALTNPDSHVSKTYRVRLDRPLAEADARRMESGMMLDERTKLRPAAVARVAGRETDVELTIQEGKNRQIRRMCESLGYDILTLHRTRIGSLDLGTLAAGKTRPLGKAEVDALRLISREDR